MWPSYEIDGAKSAVRAIRNVAGPMGPENCRHLAANVDRLLGGDHALARDLVEAARAEEARRGGA